MNVSLVGIFTTLYRTVVVKPASAAKALYAVQCYTVHQYTQYTTMPSYSMPQ